MSDLYERLQQTAGVLAERTGCERHDVVVVLGSGLGGYPDRIGDKVAVSYGDLPGFPIPTAVGHAGTAYSTQMGGNRVLLLSGRAHAYEGHDTDADHVRGADRGHGRVPGGGAHQRGRMHAATAWPPATWPSSPTT